MQSNAMQRLANNPLITPADVPPTRDGLEVLCALNPGAVRFGGEALLLVRVGERPIEEPGSIAALTLDAETAQPRVRRFRLDDPDLTIADGRVFFYRNEFYLTSMSHLRLARSRDLRQWTVDAAPAIWPTTAWEEFGCEDARITAMDDGRFIITYTAVGRSGVGVMLAETRDFVKFDKRGLAFPTFNKDVCVFDRPVRGRYVCRHRPGPTEWNRACIWTAWSPDLLHWGDHTVLLAPAPGTWQGQRVGAGAPPIRTGRGWLEIYHAADVDGRYALGAMLSDLEHPERMIRRSRRPVLEPQAEYERAGVYGQCVFSNGLLVEPDGRLVVFYGAADTICAAAVTTVDEMLDAALHG